MLSGLAWLSLALIQLFVFLLSPWRKAYQSFFCTRLSRALKNQKKQADSAAIGLENVSSRLLLLLVPEECFSSVR